MIWSRVIILWNGTDVNARKHDEIWKRVEAISIALNGLIRTISVPLTTDKTKEVIVTLAVSDFRPTILLEILAALDWEYREQVEFLWRESDNEGWYKRQFLGGKEE